jgi:hypothetical protein
MRSILPSRLVIDCAFAPLAFSATAAYSLPSAPNASAPPLWLVAELRLSSSRITVSLPATATSPLAVKRLIRLWIAGVVAV